MQLLIYPDKCSPQVVFNKPSDESEKKDLKKKKENE